MFGEVWFALGAETVEDGAEMDNNFSSSRKCGLHGVPKTTKSTCRKKVPKRVVFSYP
jgi:hypothetical protein